MPKSKKNPLRRTVRRKKRRKNLRRQDIFAFDERRLFLTAKFRYTAQKMRTVAGCPAPQQRTGQVYNVILHYNKAKPCGGGVVPGCAAAFFCGAARNARVREKLGLKNTKKVKKSVDRGRGLCYNRQAV
jgi:hypothetical protein